MSRNDAPSCVRSPSEAPNLYLASSEASSPMGAAFDQGDAAGVRRSTGLPTVLRNEGDEEEVTRPHTVIAQAKVVEIVRLPADIIDLVPRFLARRCEDVVALHDAVIELDFATVRRIGHTLVGSARTYRFERLALLGAAIERASIDEDMYQVALLTAEIEVYLERVRVVPET